VHARREASARSGGGGPSRRAAGCEAAHGDAKCLSTQIRMRLRAMSYFRDKLFRLSPVKNSWACGSEP
jgi:hypothetical protein